jgi:hypothetical protein
MHIIPEPRRGSPKLRMDPEMIARRIKPTAFRWTAAMMFALLSVGCDSNHRPPAAAVNGSAPATTSALPLDAAPKVASEGDIPVGEWRPAADSHEAAVIPEPAAAQEPVTEAPSANKQIEDAPATAEIESQVNSKKSHDGGATSLKFASAHPEYFVGWPKPQLALVISGKQDG